MKESKRFQGTRLAALLLCLTLAFPIVAHAEDGKTVRVGWYESPFNQTDPYGRRSGYAYEYQQKIAAYTGWRYEYVYGSWPDLMQMLTDGEIDLMSDISYTVGRARSILYSMAPMGAEEYYVFVSSVHNSGVNSTDYTSFSGKKFGINKGSVQVSMFRNWASKKGVEVEIVELTASEAETVAMLDRGEVDALVAIDGFGGGDTLLPVCKIGSSDFYFAVSKTRPELLKELDAALLKIQEENAYYNQQLQEKYFGYSGSTMYLAENELNWLSEHGAVRVGYRDNYLAFCAKDQATGELTGALEAFLSLASRSLQNAQIVFEAVPFSSTTDALEALKRGEIDCVFPVNFSAYDAEEMDVLTTVPLMQSEMYAVVRSAGLRDFSMASEVRAAINEGNHS